MADRNESCGMDEAASPPPTGGRQGFVNSVFARVADRYDLMNDLMSARMHRLWKDDLIAWLNPPKQGPHTLLDVAGGTGDVALRYLNASGGGARCIVCDISAEMVRVGRARAEHAGEGRLAFVQGNAEALPMSDKSVDAYTIAFGIRNVPRIPVALGEMYRVLKTGGRFLCLEFSQVDVPMLEELYEAYSFRVIPQLGRAVAGDAESYRYLVESIRKFPSREAFAAMIREAGFSRVEATPLSGGIVAIHSGWRL